jgi:hypothetical protein
MTLPEKNLRRLIGCRRRIGEKLSSNVPAQGVNLANVFSHSVR